VRKKLQDGAKEKDTGGGGKLETLEIAGRVQTEVERHRPKTERKFKRKEKSEEREEREHFCVRTRRWENLPP